MHTVVAIPVPALELPVRERTAFYDASWVSVDPEFVHAHITVLAPWVPEPSAADLSVLDRIAAGTAPFELSLDRLATFPDGVIHLVPEPDGPVRALTSQVAAAFPGYPPYEGRYATVDPHLTLDRIGPGVTVSDVAERIAPWLPARMAVTEIHVQHWANHDCRLLTRHRLAGSGG